MLWLYAVVSQGTEPYTESQIQSVRSENVTQSNSIRVRASALPDRPPDRPANVPSPKTPPNMETLGQAVYTDGVAKNVVYPARVALRKQAKLYINYNRQFADAQAQAEGISLEEVEELTYFGFLAQRSQRWSDVEDILGRKLSTEVRTAAERMLNDLNDEFTQAVRKMVSEGSLKPERWKYIRELQQRYLEDYFTITEMNEAYLEMLLAYNINRASTLSEALTPEEEAQTNPEYPEPIPPRPEREP